MADLKALMKDMASKTHKAKEMPRVVIGDATKDPYIVEVTLARAPKENRFKLVEIQIHRAPNVGEARAKDVITHALIDVFGPNPPAFVNEFGVPVIEWFDHQEMEKLAEGEKVLGGDSMRFLLNEEESSVRRGALDFLARTVWQKLIGRHERLKKS